MFYSVYIDMRVTASSSSLYKLQLEFLEGVIIEFIVIALYVFPPPPIISSVSQPII